MTEDESSAHAGGAVEKEMIDIGESTAEPLEKVPSKVPQSCSKVFDSLYFCYSPFYQARKYYMYGEFDNCRGRLRRFRLCLLSRIKNEKDSEMLFEEEERRAKEACNLKDAKPVWEMREEYLDNVARAEQDSPEPSKEKESWWL